MLRCWCALSLAFFLLLSLPGCDFVVSPLGGSEGRTLVYVAQGKAGAPNAGIICTRQGCVVIDPMLSPTVSASLHSQALAKSRIFWDNLHTQRKERARTQAPPVLYVLNTTFRASHTFGNQEFEPTADIVSTPRARERLELDGRAMREELRDLWKVPGLESHAVTTATLTVDGTLNIDTQDIKIQFISMGDCVGEGDAVVYLPGQKVLFAGDLVIPGYIPYHKSRTLTLKNWISALKTLESWEIESVVPGHGEVARKDAIKTQREFLEALLSEVEQAVKNGKSLEETAQSVKLPKYSKWLRYDEWLSENVKLAYRELKGGPAVTGGTPPGAGVVEPKIVDRPDSFRAK
ncbi:MAG TPA: MBL fold metallo-hydrolase [Planctomycetota bacterium]|nr:MBL fold metallo-hydrolase [Planctomycetota bacterium]